MRRAVLGVVALVLSCLPVDGLVGQVVRGQAVESATNKPLSGAFIILRDEEGTRRGAVLSDSAGNFIVRAPGAGRYTLVMERIGFESITSPVLELGQSETIVHRFLASVEPVSLEGITATGKGRCHTPREIGAETSRVWDEARKALSISAWMEEDPHVAFQWYQFERVRSLASLKIEDQEVHFRSGIGASPFESPTPEDLSTGGFVRSLPNGEYRYLGLDARTLLSDEFLATHCFRLEDPKRDEDGLIGLAFEPIPTNHLPEITGVLWLDRQTSEVRYLEFHYTRHMLPIPVPLDPFGGRVEFRRLANGAWIVDRWWLRMPQMVTRILRQTQGRVVRPTDTARDSLLAAHQVGVRIWEEGGEVRFINQPGANANGGATVEGVVFDLDDSRPLAGARVFLTHSPRSARTDSEGRFRLLNLPEGADEIAFIHPAADALGLVVSPQPISLVSGQRTWIDLSIPKGIICGGAFEDPQRGGLTGLVVHRDGGDPLPGARVTATWFGKATAEGGEGEAQGHSTVRADREGRFLFCSVPLGRTRLTLAEGNSNESAEISIEGMGLYQKDLIVR